MRLWSIQYLGSWRLLREKYSYSEFFWFTIFSRIWTEYRMRENTEQKNSENRIQKSGLGRNLGKNLTILLGFNFINLAFSKIEDERTHFDNACEIYNVSFMNYNLWPTRANKIAWFCKLFLKEDQTVFNCEAWQYLFCSINDDF